MMRIRRVEADHQAASSFTRSIAAAISVAGGEDAVEAVGRSCPLDVSENRDLGVHGRLHLDLAVIMLPMPPRLVHGAKVGDWKIRLVLREPWRRRRC